MYPKNMNIAHYLLWRHDIDWPSLSIPSRDRRPESLVCIPALLKAALYNSKTFPFFFFLVVLNMLLLKLVVVSPNSVYGYIIVIIIHGLDVDNVAYNLFWVFFVLRVFISSLTTRHLHSEVKTKEMCKKTQYLCSNKNIVEVMETQLAITVCVRHFFITVFSHSTMNYCSLLLAQNPVSHRGIKQYNQADQQPNFKFRDFSLSLSVPKILWQEEKLQERKPEKTRRKKKKPPWGEERF